VAPVTLVSRLPESAPVAAHLAGGGRAVLVADGDIVLAEGSRRAPLVSLADVPITYGGTLAAMIEDALAAAAAALALRVSPDDVARGLRTFHNSPQQNPGRLNVVRLRRPERIVVVDQATDTVALGHLLDFGERLRAPGGRLVAVVSAPGDRRDEDIEAVGRLAGARADWVWICHRNDALRGRTPEEMAARLVAGVRAARDGGDAYACAGDSLDGLRRAVADARAKDVVLMMYCKYPRAAFDVLGVSLDPRWRRAFRWLRRQLARASLRR
jgi:cyanophycin synthetase